MFLVLQLCHPIAPDILVKCVLGRIYGVFRATMTVNDLIGWPRSLFLLVAKVLAIWEGRVECKQLLTFICVDLFSVKIRILRDDFGFQQFFDISCDLVDLSDITV